jgi:hypothetical protein
VGRRIGNGENTSFWSDPWLEGGVLRDRFRRLFEPSVDPDVSVAAMRRDGWEVDKVGWRWRRRLFAWEEEPLIDCARLLDNIFCRIT